MKIKLFFLSLAAIVLTYLIFNANNHQEIKITTIYDDTTTIKENFSTFLKKDLEKLLPTTINDYHKENLEVENVVDKKQLPIACYCSSIEGQLRIDYKGNILDCHASLYDPYLEEDKLANTILD